MLPPPKREGKCAALTFALYDFRSPPSPDYSASSGILDAKAEAHTEYATIRSELPAICQEAEAAGGGEKIEWGVEDGGWWTLQNFVIERLNNAGIEGAVNAMQVYSSGVV